MATHSQINRATQEHFGAQQNRNPEEEQKILQWISNITHENPSTDFEHYIQDGSVLSKVMISLVYNSVPKEVINVNWGSKPAADRVRTLIFEMKRYGVHDIFEPADLLEMKDIPKVTRCLQELSQLAAAEREKYKEQGMIF